MRTVALTKESTKDILENLLKRSPNNYGKFEAAVDEILNKVKTEGDAALFAYTKEFDKTEISADTIKVTEEEIKEAYEAVDPALIDVIRKALVNIRSYHEKQRQNSWFTSETNGTMLGQKVTALERVGVYVPGGKAVYPSSVLMNIVPAKVAGVDQIVMTTPPGKDGKVNPSTLVAAKEAGADEIYKVGGAQAIGALAYGTESIPKVDKIVGPGNIFVALAKKAVYGYVSIDRIARIGKILGAEIQAQAAPKEIGRIVSDSLQSFNRSIGIGRLSDYGVTEEQLDSMAEYAIHEGGTQGNSFRPSPKAEVVEYLKSIL